MIVSIPNQPLVFEDKDSESGFCSGVSDYCQPIQQHDKLCFQHRQSSCLPQLLCSPDFSELGDEMIIDGDFYSNPYGQGGWDFDETDWSWDEAGKKLCINTEGGYSEVLYNITTDPDCTGLRFTFTVSDLTDAVTNELIVTLPDGSTVTIEENGVYEYIVDPGPEIKFSPEANFDGCIDDISLRCIAECWTIITESESATNGGLSFNIPGICKPSSIGVTFEETTGTLVSGKYYQVWIDTSSIISGSVEFFLGGVSIGTIDESGIEPLYGTSGGTKFSFTMSADFSGCINSINVYQLSNDYTLSLVTTNDIFLADLTSDLIYYKDQLRYCLNVSPEFINSLPDFSSPQKDCWKMVFESPDDGELMIKGDFSLGVGQTLLDYYDIQDNGGFEILGSENSAIFSAGEGYLSQDLSGHGPPGLVAGTEYYVEFDITCLTGTAQFDSFVMSLGSDNSNIGGNLVFGSTDFPTAVGHYIYKVTAGSDGSNISLYFNDTFTMTGMCITNLSVRLTPCAKETKTGNCINYHADGLDNTKILTACNEEGESMGFDWTDFKLRARVPCMITGPKYASPEDETYLFSDGRRNRVFARSEKTMDLLIERVGELQHDFIRAMLKCDNFWISDDYSLTKKYMVLDNEYVPEWDRKAMPTTAEARVEIQIYNNTIFNTNCK